jgi:hypothetical protein
MGLQKLSRKNTFVYPSKLNSVVACNGCGMTFHCARKKNNGILENIITSRVLVLEAYSRARDRWVAMKPSILTHDLSCVHVPHGGADNGVGLRNEQ